jgi:hypothetical protein
LGCCHNGQQATDKKRKIKKIKKIKKHWLASFTLNLSLQGWVM